MRAPRYAVLEYLHTLPGSVHTIVAHPLDFPGGDGLRRARRKVVGWMESSRPLGHPFSRACHYRPITSPWQISSLSGDGTSIVNASRTTSRTFACVAFLIAKVWRRRDCPGAAAVAN